MSEKNGTDNLAASSAIQDIIASRRLRSSRKDEKNRPACSRNVSSDVIVPDYFTHTPTPPLNHDRQMSVLCIQKSVILPKRTGCSIMRKIAPVLISQSSIFEAHLFMIPLCPFSPAMGLLNTYQPRNKPTYFHTCPIMKTSKGDVQKFFSLFYNREFVLNRLSLGGVSNQHDFLMVLQ